MTRQEIIDILESLRIHAICSGNKPPGCTTVDCYIAKDIIQRLKDGEEIETTREIGINQALEEWIEGNKP